MNAGTLSTAAGMGSKDAQKQIKKLNSQARHQEQARTVHASAPIPLTEEIPFIDG